MKLTVNEAIEELKKLKENEDTENHKAIKKRYGSLENSRKARKKMRDFIIGCGYCSDCYEKQKSVDDIEFGMCNACYKWAENQYLFGDI